jgi:hypothetical protein
MLVGVDDRRFFSGQFGSAEWPAAQIARAFDKLPKYAMVAKLFDDGRDYTPVLLNSVPRGKRLAGYDPLLVAVVDPNQPHGYRLESYQPGWHGQALRISETEGMEGFWEPSLPNGAILPEFPLRAPGFIQPATPQFCPNLIEELTTFLYRKGELEWGFTPFDPKAAQVAGYGPEAIDQINRSETDLAAGQKMLMEIENIGDRTEREARLMELSEEEWQLYRGFRKSRDTQLREVIGQHRSLIPEKRNRILTLSRLWVGTPVAEIEAERLRPDIFSIEAEAIREEMLAEAEAEEAAKQAGKKGRGSGGPKKATVA